MGKISCTRCDQRTMYLSEVLITTHSLIFSQWISSLSTLTSITKHSLGWVAGARLVCSRLCAQFWALQQVNIWKGNWRTYRKRREERKEWTRESHKLHTDYEQSMTLKCWDSQEGPSPQKGGYSGTSPVLFYYSLQRHTYPRGEDMPA